MVIQFKSIFEVFCQYPATHRRAKLLLTNKLVAGGLWGMSSTPAEVKPTGAVGRTLSSVCAAPNILLASHSE
jgi:hypothetical protein